MLRLVLDTQIWLDWLVFDDPGVRDLRIAVEKGRADRHRWAQQVLGQLGWELGELGGYRFEIHAGMAYVDFGLREGLVRSGAEVVVPTQGLRQGEQLALYRDRARTIRG